MSSHGKRQEPTLVASTLAITNDDFSLHLSKSGLRAKWAGPCDAMQAIFKRFKTEFGEDLTVSQAQSDEIDALADYRNKSCPTFLFYYNGTLVKVARGCNSPLVEKYIREQLSIEKAGLAHVPLDSGDQALESLPSVKPVVEAVAAEDSDGPIEKTLMIIKPDAMRPSLIEEIMEAIKSNRFEILMQKKTWLSPEIVAEFYKEHENRPFYNELITYLSCAPVLAFVLSKPNAVSSWRKIMGPANVNRAKQDAPKSLRARFGTDARLNAVFGSSSVEAAEKEIDLIFGAENKAVEIAATETELTGSHLGAQKTLVIINPNIVRAGKVEEIIDKITCRGYQITSRDEVILSAGSVESIFVDSKDHPQYAEFSTFMQSGSSLILIVKGEDVIGGMLEMRGPMDPVEAKISSPQSLRAIYGTDIIHNGVHCSVSIEKAVYEIQCVFPKALTRRGSYIFATRPSSAADLSTNQIGEAALSAGANPSAVITLLKKMTDQRTLALIKPDAYGSGKKDEIIEKVKASGFKVVLEMEVHFSAEKASEFYKDHSGKSFYPELVSWMSSAPTYAMILEKDNAIAGWRELAGPTNTEKAKEIAPESIRAIYGTDGTKNAVHGSDSPDSAEREMILIFGEELGKLTQNTLTKRTSSSNVLSSSQKLGLEKSLTNLKTELPVTTNLKTELPVTIEMAETPSQNSANVLEKPKTADIAKSISGNNLSKNADEAVAKESSASNLAKTPSASQVNKSIANVAKAPSGANLTKSPSGASLRKAPSGSNLIKSIGNLARTLSGKNLSKSPSVAKSIGNVDKAPSGNNLAKSPSVAKSIGNVGKTPSGNNLAKSPSVAKSIGNVDKTASGNNLAKSPSVAKSIGNAAKPPSSKPGSAENLKKSNADLEKTSEPTPAAQ